MFRFLSQTLFDIVAEKSIDATKSLFVENTFSKSIQIHRKNIANLQEGTITTLQKDQMKCKTRHT